MITATLNSRPLELAEGFTFEVRRKSQLFSTTNIEGEVVTNISFADTERNRNELQHPNRFSLVRNTREFTGLEIRENGRLVFAGTLVLTNGFGGSARGAIGNLAAKQQDKLITDHTLPVNQVFVNKTNYVPGTDDYCAPYIVNQSFFADLGQKAEDSERTIFQKAHGSGPVGWAINRPAAEGVLINNDPISFADNSLDDYDLTVVSPMLFLFTAIEKLLKANGYYIVSNALPENSDLLKLLVYNNVDINMGNISEINVDQQIFESRFGDEISVAGYTYNLLLHTISSFNYAQLLPKVTLKEFLLGVQNLLNIAFVFNPDETVSIIDRETVIDLEPQDLDPYFIGEWEPGEKKNVSIKFAQKHDEKDALFGDTYKDLSDRIADFGDDVADMTTLLATTGTNLGELRRVLSTQRIYEWNYTTAANEEWYGLEKSVVGWIFISIDFQPGLVNYTPEKELETIETCFSTLSALGVPVAQQPGQTKIRKTDEAPFSPRLLFYTGNGNAANHTTSYSLKFTGTKNMIETRWKNWSAFLATREPYTGNFDIPGSVLKNLDLNRPCSTRHGSFLIDELVEQISQNGAKKIQMKVYKL